jgi:hypothetical protein
MNIFGHRQRVGRKAGIFKRLMFGAGLVLVVLIMAIGYLIIPDQVSGPSQSP